MVDFVPVDHDPFAPSLVPVDHDPFAAQPVDYDPFAAEKFVPAGIAASMPDVAQRDVAALKAFPTMDRSKSIQATFDNNPEAHLDAAMNVAMSAGPGTIKGIKAYHGSPHDFDRFDLSKIGTGEGAQAYGHGLYFAENPETARAYRDQLSGKPVSIPDVDSPHFQQSVREAIANNAVQVADRNVELAKKSLTEKINSYAPGRARDDYEAALEMLHENPHKYAGRMYEVNINADPEHFLDWDKPLSEQPTIVQDMARNADLSHLAPGNRTRRQIEMWRDGTLPNKESEPTGNVLHSALTDYGMNSKNNAALTDKFRDAGIPGIKYLDQGSRAAGDGSRNYVVFDHNLIDIVRKYALAGVALPPAIKAAYDQMQQGQPQPSGQPDYMAGLRK